jgi:predicted enzyme related to lactoylglutathione lyase
MPHIDKHPPGAFCWIELSTTDQNAAKSFYSSLFGWAIQEFPMGPNDFYTMFQLEGRETAAAYTMRAEQQSLGIPPNWMIYIAVASADDAASRATPLGGKVLAPPFDVFDVGRMAVVQDPTGAVFALWQAKSHTGTGIAGVHGTFCWGELITPDVARAKEFYTGLFGWKISTSENDPSGYEHIANGEDFIGGVPPAKYRDPNAPPHWMAYFYVSNCDETAAKTKELGGKTLLAPMAIEKVGRMAILADPQGAVFAVIGPEASTHPS